MVVILFFPGNRRNILLIKEGSAADSGFFGEGDRVTARGGKQKEKLDNV